MAARQNWQTWSAPRRACKARPYRGTAGVGSTSPQDGTGPGNVGAACGRTPKPADLEHSPAGVRSTPLQGNGGRGKRVPTGWNRSGECRGDLWPPAKTGRPGAFPGRHAKHAPTEEGRAWEARLYKGPDRRAACAARRFFSCGEFRPTMGTLWIPGETLPA